ncbi:uncharacterized protein B0I36DRAFT_88833 [Microdochium trichocladiopsis]|uniref:SAM and PH domain-containing protein n=1 Tax=Microdochium trichocladiopsis TaxID=1682393 RepID=A0A9P9BWJ8_9PEZI|nr:uncharacterized protein B0I36DRAFT_88833 [Microdochium trichocladiopsis]KAH7035146.1 hypothetical protein B0I36DRAFT_88833 [Microdochium trichocladiopsis]
MYTQFRPSEQSQMEMRQKSRLHDPFFGLKTMDLRPESVATEIMDTDWDDDIISDNEDEMANSPRVSLNSSGQPSFTTLSSYEEAHTPRSSRAREAYPFDLDPATTIQGPRGPHLFRSSTSSSQNFDFQETLTLSPITPKAPNQGMYSLMPETYSARESIYQFTLESLEIDDLVLWSPEQVAQWMLDAGVELSVAEKFVENDINGAILITLKFEDLRELQIQSFGVRTKIWEEIHKLRDSKPPSPRPETPIEDEEDKEVKRERKQQQRAAEFAEIERSASVNRQKSMKKKRPSQEDIISPLESVSIVGIEQMMPKLHTCSKGENCSKWRRNQRLIEAFKKDHPFVDMDKGGVIMMAGNPGNPQTAPALNRPSSMEALRPFSDAVPSVVASSDVMGLGGLPPLQYLQEAALRNLQTRDPQDNVVQFLDFQHQHDGCDSSEVPPTPPFELQPTPQPHTGLRSLPKLSIPGHSQRSSQSSLGSQQSQTSSQPISEPPRTFTPYQMEKVEARDPALQTPIAPYRFGTPFSDMDVPVTSVPLGPVARDASQSVPPDMSYRAGPSAGIPRSMSRASRRPSFQVMEPLEEHVASSSMRPSPRSPPRPSRTAQPAQAPPRTVYPWSPIGEPAPSFQSTLPSNVASKANEILTGGVIKDAEGISYQGPVRKRKTKMLRHEWHEQYATLKGTRLALHRDRESRERTLEYIDIDDYAIACSSLSATSKLNAAFKAMSISRGGDKRRSAEDPVGAFSFQLIPADGKHIGRLRKRESASISGPVTGIAATTGAAEGVNGTGKTHHFAVRGRDERIDWMRELMLAKALKQKGEGFEVSVNGNMI